MDDAILKNLQALCAFNTVSSDEMDLDHGNIEFISWLKSKLDGLGFSCEVNQYSQKWANLYAVRGEPKVLLSGHSDTVPAVSEKWDSDPWKLEMRGDKAYGLGACDMKGFLAAALTLAEKSTLDFALLVTAEEETSMRGALEARDFLRAKGHSYPLIIIGEPTENVPVIAHKGWMYCELTIKGRGAHSSNPELGENALEKLPEVIQLLMAQKEWMGRVKGEIGEHPTLNLGKITGGDCANRVCEEVKLIFDVRPTAAYPVEKVCLELGKIERILKAKGIQAAISYPFPHIAPLAAKIDGETCALLEELSGNKVQAVNYCTEGSILQDLGPCVIMGPGSIAQAHQADEFAAIASLDAGYELLAQLIARINP